MPFRYPFSSDNSFIIPHFLSFVNPFLRSFSNFFAARCLSFGAALILYHFQSSLSSTFFKFFQKTFSVIASLWQTSFFIISHPDSFVNPFSEVFSKSFILRYQLLRRAACLLYHFSYDLSSSFSKFLF